MWNKTFQAVAEYWWLYIIFFAGLLLLGILWTVYEKRSRSARLEKMEREANGEAYKLASIVSGLGGVDNIYDLDCCATRLRVVVNDDNLVDRNMLRSTGASGILGKRRGIQIIYGSSAGRIKSELAAYLDKLRDGEDGSTDELYENDERIIEKLYAPIEGDIIALDNLSCFEGEQDQNGDGIAIIPRRGELRAPFDGKITAVVKGRGQLNLISVKGVEVMVRIGSMTELQSAEYVHMLVKEGDMVRKGRLLAEFDLEAMEAAGYDTTSLVLVTNSKNFGKVYEHCREDVNYEHVALVLRQAGVS